VEARALLDVDETAEKEKCKTSVIIHGIKESDSEDSKEREEDDLGVVASMLHELKCENAAVQKVVRLGKRLDSVEYNVPTKPRPMKMVVETEEQRNLIIRSAKNLRLAQEGDWKTVYIHQDLTPIEREQRRQLVSELKDRKQKGEVDLIVRSGTAPLSTIHIHFPSTFHIYSIQSIHPFSIQFKLSHTHIIPTHPQNCPNSFVSSNFIPLNYF